MGGFFGVASKQDCVFDLFFGIDYHSHLGTRRGGMAVYGKDGFNRSIHNIENAPFRTKFDKDMQEMSGNLGIGCISDYEPQPLIVRSHHGTYALTTVSKINNMEQLTQKLFDSGHSHFQEMSGGDINATELIAALINQKANLIEGIHYALEEIDGSVSVLLMNQAGIYAARDKYGRTPVVVGKKDDAYCVSFENYAYKNLGYSDYKELGPGEIVVVTDKNCVTLMNPNEEMKICTFLWVYYGYPASSYEGHNVENMRYRCGQKMAQRDNVKPDIVAGVPDSGTAHAVGYVYEAVVAVYAFFVTYFSGLLWFLHDGMVLPAGYSLSFSLVAPIAMMIIPTVFAGVPKEIAIIYTAVFIVLLVIRNVRVISYNKAVEKLERQIEEDRRRSKSKFDN